jgi:hypothetical protein
MVSIVSMIRYRFQECGFLERNALAITSRWRRAVDKRGASLAPPAATPIGAPRLQGRRVRGFARRAGVAPSPRRRCFCSKSAAKSSRSVRDRVRVPASSPDCAANGRGGEYVVIRSWLFCRRRIDKTGERESGRSTRPASGTTCQFGRPDPNWLLTRFC